MFAYMVLETKRNTDNWVTSVYSNPVEWTETGVKESLDAHIAYWKDTKKYIQYRMWFYNHGLDGSVLRSMHEGIIEPKAMRCLNPEEKDLDNLPEVSF